ncbi:MAG: KTSC domain-containing protein [Burkholderiales bacterium]|nr:KTSC domain-containing protein [Burkholderiales bacterium]
MERKRLHAGELRAAGYDEARRVLEVELANGQLIEYAGVGREIARRLMTSASPLSYYRDNIADEFTARPAGRVRSSGGDDNPFA